MQCLWVAVVVMCCSDYVLQHAAREDHIVSFMSWLSEHGVDTSAVSVELFGDAGHGLKAARDLQVSAVIPLYLTLLSSVLENCCFLIIHCIRYT